MANLPPDPLANGGIAGFGERLRSGETPAEAPVAADLRRIEVLEPRLGPFEPLAAERALPAAPPPSRPPAAGPPAGDRTAA